MFQPPAKRQKTTHALPYNIFDEEEDELGLEPAQVNFLRDPGIQLEVKHVKSAINLKSRFEQIFAKYGKELEGDEVDLQTGSIVVDRGHVASLEDPVVLSDEDDIAAADVVVWGKKRRRENTANKRPLDPPVKTKAASSPILPPRKPPCLTPRRLPLCFMPKVAMTPARDPLWDAPELPGSSRWGSGGSGLADFLQSLQNGGMSPSPCTNKKATTIKRPQSARTFSRRRTVCGTIEECEELGGLEAPSPPPAVVTTPTPQPHVQISTIVGPSCPKTVPLKRTAPSTQTTSLWPIMSPPRQVKPLKQATPPQCTFLDNLGDLSKPWEPVLTPEDLILPVLRQSLGGSIYGLSSEPDSPPEPNLPPEPTRASPSDQFPRISKYCTLKSWLPDSL